MTTNIGDVCRVSPDAASKHERTALRLIRPDFSVEAFSFGQMDLLANQFANVLEEIGEGRGTVVAILLPKGLDVFFGFLGMLKAGSIVLPLFANFRDMALVDRLADCAATCVLTKRSSVARLEGIRAQLPALRTVLVIDSEQDLGPGVLSLPARMGRASSVYQSQPVERDTPSLLHYTSGSTGKPKWYFWFSARNDDVINTSGHLVSPFEVESAVLELAEVTELAAVGVPDPILFEKIVVFVALRPGVQADEELQMKIRLYVANRLSAVAAPRDVIFIDKIPKNKSGKILRRILRARCLGEDPGDISTIEDQP